MTYPPPRRLNWLPLAIHLVITAGVIIIGVSLVPRWNIHIHLNKLTDSLPKERERGLNYVIHHAAHNPKVLIGAIDRLSVPDPTNFLQIVSALDHAGQWKRPIIPNAPWLRWLSAIAQDHSPEARTNAAYFAAGLADLADNPQLLVILKRLISDTAPEVRSETLKTIVQLSGASADRSHYKKLLRLVAADPMPTIARQAWIVLGLLDDPPQKDAPIRWRSTPPPVAQAALWASHRVHTKPSAPFIDAINDPSIDPTVAAMAVYCLHFHQTESSQKILARLVQHTSQPIPDAQQLIIWRAVLGTRHTPDPPFTTEQAAQALDDPLRRPLALAALYRGLFPVQPQLKLFLDTSGKHTIASLAVLEGLPVGQYTIPLTPDMPDMLRLAAIAVTQNPNPEDLFDLFASDASTLRDLACIVARDRFSTDQLTKLTASLLHDFNDNAKCSGAILSGLTGLQTKLLDKKARDEDIWSVQQILKLGLWMQGREPDMKKLAPGLLSRGDLPTTTILLAMLHRNHPMALEYLFNPPGEESTDLIEWLDQHRWWRVLQRYLPKDAPPFWVWADPDLEQFQIDVLRNWYLLNRHKLLSR